MRLSHGFTFSVFIVSIHASVKDATQGLPSSVINASSFNPRICKRCDLPAKLRLKKEMVSIHASVKDATLSKFAVRDQVSVSIHASVKDATLFRHIRFPYKKQFQSTHL